MLLLLLLDELEDEDDREELPELLEDDRDEERDELLSDELLKNKAFIKLKVLYTQTISRASDKRYRTNFM